MSETTLKVQLGADIRRLSLKPLESYTEFVKVVRNIFNISDLSGVQLSYEDEDRDVINIRSQMDLDEARRYAATVPSFKIRVAPTDDLSQSPPSQLPIYPPIAPEDIDLTSSFADLMTDSMHHLEAARAVEAEPSKVDEQTHSVVPSILPTKPIRSRETPSKSPVADSSSATSPNSGAKIDSVAEKTDSNVEAEAHFHQTLEELADAQTQPSDSAGVLDTVETKFKTALDALVEFMESLKLDQKMRAVVAEFEPTFAKFEQKVITPINDFGQRTSRDLHTEMSGFQKEINLLRAKIQTRIEQISGSDSSSDAQEQEASVENVHEFSSHNALEDLHKLEAMGFSDRRRNLELLAIHKGDINAVVAALLD